MQNEYRAKITSKGQLTVPRQVRESLGVGPGDEVAFEVGPEGVKVAPVRTTNPFAALEGRWRVGKGLSAEEIDAWIREIRGHDEEE